MKVWLDDSNPALSIGDPRCTTFASRVDLGFTEDPSDWRVAEAHINDGTLTILGHPVMQNWETPYMSVLAHIASVNGGTILEVGFGLGISARFIQQLEIDKHIIIEANLDIFNQLKKFSLYAAKKVLPVYGFWQDIIDTIPSDTIDGILFDTYPLSVDEIHGNHFPFFHHAYRILKPGGVFTYYSDEINSLSPIHYETLKEAGFSQIDFTVCTVHPPEECLYWKSDSIVAPVIYK